MKYDSRIKGLENRCGFNDQYKEVLEWIKNGRYYDELTDSEKDLYISYYFNDIDRKSFEEVQIMVLKNEENPLHFKLEPKKKPPTPEEMNNIIKEVEELVFKHQYAD